MKKMFGSTFQLDIPPEVAGLGQLRQYSATTLIVPSFFFIRMLESWWKMKTVHLTMFQQRQVQ